jgi:4-hydroxybenzoate polyprenyltransferase
MVRTTTAPPSWRIHLRLGRVSNLPTVWSNCLAGATIALGAPPAVRLVWVAGALSLFYTAGMFLNDAFDADHDRAARPERPIPQGWVDRRHVLMAGLALLASGEVLLAAAVSGGSRPAALIYGAGLAALILYYNWRHKRDRFSAVVMAACRAFVYVIAAAAVTTTWPSSLIPAAVMLAAYVIVLSQIAKRDLVGGRYIAMLIAGISLVDAVLIAAITGSWSTAAIAALGYPATLMLQRFAPGT